jgi:hypothetical protein
MKTTNEILNDFESIDKRVYILSLLVDDYLTLFEVKIKLANQFSFIRRAKNAIACYMIHEFCKLLNPDEKGSYPKFLKKTINNFKRINWSTDVDIDYLKDFMKEFEQKVYNKTYNQLINIRDKICGHYDLLVEKDVPTFDEFRTFIALLKELHFDLNSTLFKSHREFEISDNEKSYFVIDWLEKYDKLRDLILTEEFNKKNSISIDTLKKYI